MSASSSIRASASSPTSTRLPLVFFLIFLGAIALMVNYLSFRHYQRWDWTSAGVFTLSEHSEEVLASLEEDVDVYVFLGSGETEFADVDELLEQYKAKSGRVRVHRIDPDRERAQYQLLAQRFGMSAMATDVGMVSPIPVVVTMGDKRRKIERDQLVKRDFENQDEFGGPSLSLESERALTGAIIEMKTGQETTVCLSQGHGEWEPDGTGRRSMVAVTAELDWDHVKTKPFALTGSEKVPETCDALYVIGPQRAFGPKQVASLDAYLKRGGSVLLALDPVLDKTTVANTGLEAWLVERKILLGKDLVLEMSRRHLLSASPLEAFIAADFGHHRIVDEIRATGGGTAMGVVRSVVAGNGSAADTLLSASEESYAETDLRMLENAEQADLKPNEQDIVGPVSLAVALEDESNKSRLVVVGDSDWLLSEYLQTPQFSNVDFLSSITGWLTQRESLMTIAPRKTNAQAVLMTEEDLSTVLVRVVGLLPFAFFIAGLGVWWSRRS